MTSEQIVYDIECIQLNIGVNDKWQAQKRQFDYFIQRRIHFTQEKIQIY